MYPAPLVHYSVLCTKDTRNPPGTAAPPRLRPALCSIQLAPPSPHPHLYPQAALSSPAALHWRVPVLSAQPCPRPAASKDPSSLSSSAPLNLAYLSPAFQFSPQVLAGHRGLTWPRLLIYPTHLAAPRPHSILTRSPLSPAPPTGPSPAPPLAPPSPGRLPPRPSLLPLPHLGARGPCPRTGTLTVLPPQGDTVHRAVLGLLSPVLQRRLDAKAGSGRGEGKGPGTTAHLSSGLKPGSSSFILPSRPRLREVPSAPRVPSSLVLGRMGWHFGDLPVSSLTESEYDLSRRCVQRLPRKGTQPFHWVRGPEARGRNPPGCSKEPNLWRESNGAVGSLEFLDPGVARDVGSWDPRSSYQGELLARCCALHGPRPARSRPAPLHR